MFSLLFGLVTALAGDIPRATIDCEAVDPTAAVQIHGEVRFLRGYESYVPAMNRFKGELSFAFADEDWIRNARTNGEEFHQARFDEPNFWSITSVSTKGEVLQITLRSAKYDDSRAYGEIMRGDGSLLRTVCQIQTILPRTSPARPSPRG